MGTQGVVMARCPGLEAVGSRSPSTRGLEARFGILEDPVGLWQWEQAVPILWIGLQGGVGPGGGWLGDASAPLLAVPLGATQ